MTQSDRAVRHAGTDAMRWLLCFAVAMLHALPRADVDQPPMWAVLAASLCRGAVPFFFVASGFYARVPVRLDWGILTRPLQRLLPVYVAWLAVYAAADALIWGQVWPITPKTLLTGGSALHLWFLPALGVSLVAVPLAWRCFGPLLTGLLCVAVAAANLACVGYRDLLHVPEIAGTRMMIAPLLLFGGMVLARARRLPALPIAAILAVAAWALSLGEEALIARLAGTPIRSHNDVAATFLFGIGLFLTARALPDSPAIRRLARLGGVSLGVYAVHLLVLRLLMPWTGQDTLGAVLLLSALTLAGATLLSLLLARIRPLRLLVR